MSTIIRIIEAYIHVPVHVQCKAWQSIDPDSLKRWRAEGRNAMEASPTARYWISTHTRHMLSGSATYNTP